MCAKFFEGLRMMFLESIHLMAWQKARGRGREVTEKNYCGRKFLIRVLKISVSVIVTTVKSLLGQKCVKD